MVRKANHDEPGKLSEIFVRRVKTLMAEQGINTHQLALKCGKPDATLHKILSGENDCSVTIAAIIADALNTPLAELLS